MNTRVGRRGVLALALGSLNAMAAHSKHSAAKRFFGRGGIPLGLQAYSLGSQYDRDPEACLTLIASLGYQAVELPWLRVDARSMRAMLDRTGLSCPSVMVRERNPFAKGSELFLSSDLDRIAEQLQTLGSTTAILSSMPIPSRFQKGENEVPSAFLERVQRGTQLDDWRQYADYLNEKGRAFARHGINIGVHNHKAEFVGLDGETPIELLLKHTDPRSVTFELDVGWAGAAGIDVATLLRRHRGRFTHMHLKDLARRRSSSEDVAFTAIGSGSVDWQDILRAARAYGVRFFFVELESGSSAERRGAAAESYRYLSSLPL